MGEVSGHMMAGKMRINYFSKSEFTSARRPTAGNDIIKEKQTPAASPEREI